MAKIGRPFKNGKEPAVNKKSVDRVFKLMHIGESFTQACIISNLNKGEVWSYIKKDENLNIQYAKAKQIMWNHKSENVIDLIEQQPERDQDGKIDSAWVAYQRLKVDTHKWLLSKVLPKMYGDKIQIEDNNRTITTPVNLIINSVSKKEDD